MTPRNAIVMLVLGLLCLLGYFMLADDSGPGAVAPPFVNWDKRDVMAVTTRSQGEELALHRRLNSSDRWELDMGAYRVRASGVAVDELLGALVRGEVRKHYPADMLNPNDLAGWGLDAPRVEIEVQLPGRRQTYRFGSSVRDGSAVYADAGPGTDVWVVASEAVAESVRMFTEGVREFRIADVSTYDVKRVEIVRSGEVTVAVEQDVSQIWRVSAPYQDYADPQKWESDTLAPLCTEKVSKWAADGEEILATYGLDAPRAELRLFRKQGGDPFVILVGKEAPEVAGGAYVMEQGTRSVGVAPARFVEALFRPALEYRDRSFSRIGIDGVGITVKLGEGADANYRLQKEGTEWDVIQPVRHPADGKSVRLVLDEIRNWHVHEFLDGAAPADKGVDETRLVRIDRAGGDATTLFIGAEVEDGTFYGQRKGDGGVVRVGGGPVRTLTRGLVQYYRRTVAELLTDELIRIGREGSDAGTGVQKLVFTRDDNRTAWRDQMSGSTGQVDRAALDRLVSALTTITAVEWVHMHDDQRRELGILPDAPATTRLNLSFHPGRSGLPDEELDLVLVIGKRRDAGGYFAHVPGYRGATNPFVLSDDVVEVLTADIIKP